MKMKNALLSALLLVPVGIGYFGNCKTNVAVSARSEKTLVDTTNLQQVVSQTIGNKAIKNTRTLLNFDGSEDYICVEFEAGGYAIYYKDNMEMLEYCPNKSMSSLKDDIYYCGPSNIFAKDNSGFRNIDTNEKMSVNKNTLNEKAKKVRDHFSKRGKKDLKVDLKVNNKVASGGTPTLDDYDYIHSDYGTRIPNHTYFDISPSHGYNNNNYCGAIAAEMLLTYHNYYSDRRIVPNNFLNGNSTTLKELNPNYCTDPNKMTYYTLGASGSIGTEQNDPNNYFAKIVKKIPSNAAYTSVTSGLKSMLKERKDAIGSTSFNYTVSDKYGGWFFGSQKVNTSGVKTEIDNGRPVILLMQESLGGWDHYIVAYGYEQYTYPGTTQAYDGFITNFGYGEDVTSIWVNSSWITAYITMNVTHEHNYLNYGIISGTNRTEYKCSICGHRTDGVILDSSTTDKRYVERFVHLPLNADLYDRIDYPDSYKLRRDYYKYYYYKPSTDGMRMIQTFSNYKDTKIDIFDSDKKTILATSSNGGYSSNAFKVYNFTGDKVYYIRVSLFPLTSEGDIKLVVTPTNANYGAYSSMLNINDTNSTQGLWVYREAVTAVTFTPPTSGTYRFTTGGTSDNVLYFVSPISGTETATFDDDSAGNLQATITKENLIAGVRYFLVVSVYSLNSSGERYSATLRVEKL